ncbi:MAG: hypothetical protein IPI35_32030 [Deltaproteobacteria bacterium]|nr:hypothetical protein [Deltaproteobacteria bacterium]
MSATSSSSARLDWGAVTAAALMLTALTATVVIGPSLGLRGWAWLGLCDLLALVGGVHELIRARRRAEVLSRSGQAPKDRSQ